MPALTVEPLMKAHHLEFIDVLKVDSKVVNKQLFEDSPPWLAKVGAIVAELQMVCARAKLLRGNSGFRR
ncbi:MAG: hypothetical protein L0219_02710 [Phycisphaerales bacterium]|nr:hypothetical protein [Phycisphaerales bacterium]